MLTRSLASVALCFVLGGPARATPVADDPSRPPVDPPLSYRIDVHFDAESRDFGGEVLIDWTHTGQRPVTWVPLHFYLNAFAHEQTTWMQEVPAWLDLDRLRKVHPDPWGYSEPRAIEQRVEGRWRAAKWAAVQPDDGNPLDRTLMRVTLPQAVTPGAKLLLRVRFAGRMPAPIARTGGVRDYFFFAQWFPKLGAFELAGVRHAERERWAARQFHGPTEFYANFADYEVTIHHPPGWVVGATGERIAAAGKPGIVRYHAEDVHDFAFVAGKQLEQIEARYRPQKGPEVALRYLFPRGMAAQIPRWRRAVEGAMALFNRRIGAYPYSTLTVVLPTWPGRRSSGMEYPTLITGVPADPLFDSFLFGRSTQPYGVAIHEFGHEYFYGVLASNEQIDAFLDEGFNSYWDVETNRDVYGRHASGGWMLGRAVRGADLIAYGLAQRASDIREALRKRPSALFFPGTWGKQIYSRSVFTFQTAANRFGQRTIDRIFAAYYKRFAFRHPDVKDFLGIAAEVGGGPVADFLREAFAQPRIPDFRVGALSSERWQPPRGRLQTPKGVLKIDDDRREKEPETGLDPAAREADGRVVMTITDPGRYRAGAAVEGTVIRRALVPVKQTRAGKGSGSFYLSKVRLEGPNWDHLPVEVAFTFADGVKVRDRWDGRASWRGYRFLRPARLLRVEIDPARRVTLDVVPQNNARLLQADTRARTDWTLWLTALTQWVAGTVGSWL